MKSAQRVAHQLLGDVLRRQVTGAWGVSPNNNSGVCGE